jgi:methylated-DNA-protein-cysteine methyltransferase-like protein
MSEQKFNFKESVLRTVALIPSGRVMSYGQIALFVGMPRAARQVGWILNGIDRSREALGLPWWRVVNNAGRISIKGSMHSAEEQRKLLTDEGVKVSKELTFEIEKYRFFPEENGETLDTGYLSKIAHKVPYEG